MAVMRRRTGGDLNFADAVVAVFAALFLSFAGYAGESKPVAPVPGLPAGPVSIREVYWQELPGVHWVYVDRAGDPWLATDKGDFSTRQLSDGQVLLLDDSKGRLWIDTRCFDGKGWHYTGISARQAYEDSAGHVFLADRTHFHVLDGENSSKQRVVVEPSGAGAHFVEDPKGRVWFWVTKIHTLKRNEVGTRGVWCYDQGKWENHNTKSGLAIEDIDAFIPLSEDRFLVFAWAEEARTERHVIWSPSRDLTTKEQDVFSVKPPGEFTYVGTDLDGLLHFFVRGLPPDKEMPYLRGGRLVMSPKGESRFLGRRETERAMRLPVGPSDANRRCIFGRLGDDPPPVPCGPTEAICRDRLGRVYFRRPSQGVGVVWPKFERPGDVVRFQFDPLMICPAFQTPDGTIWGEPYRQDGWSFPAEREVPLYRWESHAWAETPVKIPPYPPSPGLGPPPWRAWAHQQGLSLPGGDMVLAIVVRDIYQDMHTEAKGELLDGQDATKRREERGPGGEPKWYEGWLYREGKWAGPAKLDWLIQQHWQAMAAAYNRPTHRSDWFAIQGDSKGRIWVVYDSGVSVIGRDGTKQWAIPERPKLSAPWYNLCPLPDGRMLLAEPHIVRVLSVKDGGIVAETFPKSPVSWDQAFFVAQDKTVWLTQGRGAAVRTWRLRGDRWEARDDLADLLFDEADGSLWFLPSWLATVKKPNERGYRVVKGDETKVFPWPAEYELGDLTPASDGRLLVMCRYWVVELSKADDPLQRSITKARVADWMPSGRPFVSKDGSILAPCFRGSIDSFTNGGQR
jgi:hypothetical protein